MRKRIKLVLFDIDGTLIKRTDLARASFRATFQSIGVKVKGIDSHPMSGKTDRQIMLELLFGEGMMPKNSKEVVDLALDRYADIYLAELQNHSLEQCGGVSILLQKMQQRDSVCLGVLTGNMRSLVRPKLESAGISTKWIAVGAYGDEAGDRNQLPEIAVLRAEKILGMKVEPESVLIIGDTPKDIECARYFGAQSLAVATGAFSVEELSVLDPDYLLPDLSHIAAFNAILLC